MKFAKILLLAVLTMFLAMAVPGVAQTTTVPQSFSITVDYDMSFTEMIAAGHYDSTSGNITEERFPVRGIGKVSREVELIHFGYDVSSDNAVKELTKRGLRPATFEELLAFGAQYPELQRKFPVAALGSSTHVRGGRYVSYLSRSGAERDISIRWWDLNWSGNDRFLAVRNK